MPKLLHIADLHLGYRHSYLGERAEERAQEAPRTLERIVDWALDPAHDISAVLIAGDLFETHEPDAELLGRAIGALSRLPAAGKTLITVPGNHDEYSYPESVYRTAGARWPGVLVATPTPECVATFDLGETRCSVYALAYTAGLSARVLPRLEAATPPATDRPPARHHARVALLHGTLDTDPADRSYRIDSATLAEAGIAYAALGHIHKPRESRIKTGWAVYPGTLAGKGFDDPGVDYLVAVDFPGGVPQIEHVRFPTRRIATRTLDLDRYDDFALVIADLRGWEDPELILRLEVVGSRPPGFDAARLRGEMARCFHHLDVDDLSVGIAPAEMDALARQPTVKGLFVQLLRQQLSEASEAGDEDRARMLSVALRKGIAAFEGHRPRGGRT